MILARDGLSEGRYVLMDSAVSGALGVLAPFFGLVTATSATQALRASGVSTVTAVAMACSILIVIHAGVPAAVGCAALGVAFWTGLTSRSGNGEWRLS